MKLSHELNASKEVRGKIGKVNAKKEIAEKIVAVKMLQNMQKFEQQIRR